MQKIWRSRLRFRTFWDGRMERTHSIDMLRNLCTGKRHHQHLLENARKSSKTDREHVIQEELQGKAQYLRDIEMIFAVP